MKIPYLSTPDIALTGTTQEFIPLADIVDDLVLFKDGSASLTLESTSLNFGLLSEKEQEAVILAYAALLNSLSFPIQIMVRTQRKDISNYIAYIDSTYQKITNPKLANLARSYRQFILDSIKKKNVLGKKFYITIPFSFLEMGLKKSVLSTTRKKGPLPYPKSYVLRKAKTALYPKRDHLSRQAGRLGLKLRQLTNSQLIELYFSIFNPEKPAVKKVQIL